MKVNFKGIWKWITEHSGTICAGVGVAGVGVTAYFSGKAAVEVHENAMPEMTKKEKLKVYAKAYWKTLLAGLLTSGAIIGSDRIHVGKEIGLAGAAYMYKDKLLEIEKKVREKFGDEAVNEIKKEMQEESLQKESEELDLDLDSDENIKLSTNEAIVYVPAADSFYRTTPKRMFYALYETNYKLHEDHDVDLLYFCKKLGKPMKSFKTPRDKAVYEAMLRDLRWRTDNKEQWFEWEQTEHKQHIDYIGSTYVKQLELPDGTKTINTYVDDEGVDGNGKVKALFFTVEPCFQNEEDLV